jgi:hypothetical protein
VPETPTSAARVERSDREDKVRGGVMVILTAWWGLGCAALMVSTILFGWYLLVHDKASGLVALILTLISTTMLWIGLISRATQGYGLPFTFSAGSAAGIALIVLLFYSVWKLFSFELETGFAVTATALMLLSFGLGQRSLTRFGEPVSSIGLLIGTLLKLGGGSLLALAAAISVTPFISSHRASRNETQFTKLGRARSQRLRARQPETANLHPAGTPQESAESRHSDLQHTSESLVRGALICLALSLAIDTWWLQKVGLGNANDAQQAGIALAWMVFFVALRLRTYPRWRGWPWAAILAIGFICVLPILINAPWLENTLPI